MAIFTIFIGYGIEFIEKWHKLFKNIDIKKKIQMVWYHQTSNYCLRKLKNKVMFPETQFSVNLLLVSLLYVL